jgi:hypothetical protein
MKIFSIIILLIIFFLSCSTTTKQGFIKKDQETIIKEYEAKDKNNWAIAEDKNTSDAYRVYLSDKSGKFAEVARRRIEENKWNLAKTINSTQSIGRYLIEYPNGVYSQEAKTLIANTPSVDHFPDQAGQRGKKIGNWGYIYKLIAFVKLNSEHDLAKEAVSEISSLLEGNFPKKDYVYSNIDFNSELIKALQENKAFIVVYAKRNKNNNALYDVLVQELGGQKATIDDVDLDWGGKDCRGPAGIGTWSIRRLKNIQIPPYSNQNITLETIIPCDRFSYYKLNLSIDKKIISIQTPLVP